MDELDQTFSEEEIDLRELLVGLWAEKQLILGITIAFTIGSLIYSLILPDIYRAESVLVPAEEQQDTNGFANQYSGAASLLGVNLGSGGSNKVNTAIAVMNSRDFIGRFIDDHNVLIPLFAGTWDSTKGNSGIDGSVYDDEENRWLIRRGEPSRLEAYRKFSDILTISGPGTNTNIVTVSIDFLDPQLASRWVNLFVSDINAFIKQRDVSEANNAISFLRGQLETIQLVEMQRVFYQLIESQTRITMLADVRDEYVFRVIDPAVVPDEKSSPRRMVIIVVGLIAGILFALLVVFIRQTMLPSSNPRN